MLNTADVLERWLLTFPGRNVLDAALGRLIRIVTDVSPSRSVDAARLLEPARVRAPVAAAGFAVPLGHAFPLFSIGENGAAGVGGVLECWSDGGMDNRNDLVRAAFGTDWSLPLARRFLCAFRRAFWNRGTLGRRHFKYPRSR